MKRVNQFLLRERYEPKDLFDEIKLHINVIGGSLSGRVSASQTLLTSGFRVEVGLG
jgi:hypothetical protein